MSIHCSGGKYWCKRMALFLHQQSTSIETLLSCCVSTNIFQNRFKILPTSCVLVYLMFICFWHFKNLQSDSMSVSFNAHSVQRKKTCFKVINYVSLQKCYYLFFESSIHISVFCFIFSHCKS